MLSQHLVASIRTSDSQEVSSTSYAVDICFFAPMKSDFHSTQLWIVDSGASRHICSNASMFLQFKPVRKSIVTLPNNASIPVCLYGDVQIASNFILKDVLFVPQFNYNLIFFSSLTTTSRLPATFFF